MAQGGTVEIDETGADRDGVSEGGEPRWLSEDERRMWVRLVGFTILLPGAVESQLKRDAGLTFFEYHVLAMLSEAEGRTRLMSELALWTSASPSRLSHVVKRLEQQGWVRREACASDGRAINAVLTDEGFAHLAEHAPAHVEEVRRLVFDRLSSDDVAALSSAMGRMLDGLEGGSCLATEAGVRQERDAAD